VQETVTEKPSQRRRRENRSTVRDMRFECVCSYNKCQRAVMNDYEDYEVLIAWLFIYAACPLYCA